MKTLQSGLLMALSATAIAQAAPMSDTQKVEALIHAVEVLPGAQFIRNGSAYDGKAAAAHLRYKRDHSGGHCASATDFIAHCASGSSLSGQPYRIRFADGHEVDAAVYFRSELDHIDTGKAPPARTR